MSAQKAAPNSANELYSDSGISDTWFLDGSPNSSVYIDVTSVWEDYTGTDVRVGVIDSQIDYNHADLSTAYDAELDYNFALDTDDVRVAPKDITDWHGTMVAGVIASEADNGVGTVGIAHDATLVGFGVDYSSSTIVDQIERALMASVDVDVVNNSWSFNKNFYDNFNQSANASLGQTLQHVAENGRDGLGTSIVFSAGNGGEDNASNYHNFQNSPYTISVGAVQANGEAWASTSIGANVLVSAAGDDVYTTRPKNGQTETDGTSFAAPAVSAVVALMYDANANLGYRDVQEILALSAEREHLSDTAPFGLGWQTNGADTFNGGGMHYSDTFGYGVVNAHNAVRLAETWDQQQTAHNRETVTIEQAVAEELVAGSQDHISVQIEVEEAIQVEHVELSMDLVWRYSGDLDVYLTSAEGHRIQLVYENDEANSIGNLRNFTFSSVASMGEMGAGTWTLDIYNRNPDAEEQGQPMDGRLIDVTLSLHGDTDGINDNTYVYTNEFGTLYRGADLAARSRLSDTNGGTDAINAAAVTSDNIIDLSGATDSRIAGRTLEISTPRAIENAYSGDGDDVLTGNGGDNRLDAGRGDDLLHWSTGDDTVYGGAGTDTLSFNGLFSSLQATISNAGTFMLGLLDTGTTTVFGVEYFQFIDVTYAAGELEAWINSGAPLPPAEQEEPEEPSEEVAAAPDPEPVEEAPREETPPQETPSQEEVVFEVDEIQTGTDLADNIYGSDGNDSLSGEAGDDLLTGGAGNDIFDGGLGNDTVRGGSGVDEIIGDQGNDRLYGQNGDDTIEGGAGNDLLNGGNGHDVLSGGAGRDRLFGRDGDDDLSGGAGRDVLKGGAGDDTLDGGTGRDVLFGGAGADTFVLDLNTSENLDVIRDFNVADGDQIMLTGLSGNGDAGVSLLQRGDDALLTVTQGDETIRLARINDIVVEDLTIGQQGDFAFLIG